MSFKVGIATFPCQRFQAVPSTPQWEKRGLSFLLHSGFGRRNGEVYPSFIFFYSTLWKIKKQNKTNKALQLGALKILILHFQYLCQDPHSGRPWELDRQLAKPLSQLHTCAGVGRSTFSSQLLVDPICVCVAKFLNLCGLLCLPAMWGG